MCKIKLSEFRMDNQKSLFAKLLYRLKNNPLIASFLILGTIVITISSFTDAIKNILPLLDIKTETETEISGKWSSPLLINQYNKKQQFYLYFEFQKVGSKISGNLVRKWPGNSDDASYRMQDIEYDGKSINFKISFKTWDEKEYYDFYSGQIRDKTIQFLVQSDGPFGYEPKQFLATLE